ncbi:hypothetical protein BN1095_1470002 [Clostridioides difficile]|uniref:Uncharacterized protein n=1 Tax=Clostridioides difficile TaxID=1496 RepID=A0A069ANL3_CLODI|nr:hypothetical protein BN1095_1470002 [Clostridioides difficile]
MASYVSIKDGLNALTMI